MTRGGSSDTIKGALLDFFLDSQIAQLLLSLLAFLLVFFSVFKYLVHALPVKHGRVSTLIPNL